MEIFVYIAHHVRRGFSSGYINGTGLITMSTNLRSPRPGRFFLFLLCAGCSVSASTAQAAPAHYSHASELNVRATPAANATLVGKLAINQPVALLRQHDSRWCEIESADGALRGYVDCSFLQASPLTLEQIDLEAAKVVLDFNRHTLHVESSSYGNYIPDNRPEVSRQLDALATLLERHFAISPSLHTYRDYNRLLLTVQGQSWAPGKKFVASHLGQLAAMRAVLSQDFAAKATVPVRYPINARVNLLLQQRRHGDVAHKARPEGPGREQGLIAGAPQPAEKTSFFRKEKWVAGWAGGPMVHRLRNRDAEGVAYALNFSGNGPWALAEVYEMAKALRAPVKASFGKVGSKDNELSRAQATVGEGAETLVLELRLPVWAITAEGLVAGTLRKVSYGGDECSQNQTVPTAAEVVFAAPVRGEIHGVFVSNAPIDPARAVIHVNKRTILEPLNSDGHETTFTHRVETTVDLDGDGVADLRSIISNDTAVGAHDGSGLMPAVARGIGGYFFRVAGWYAFNVYMLQVNEDGWWRTLSRHDLVTCT